MKALTLSAFKLSASTSLSLDVSNVGIHPGLEFLEYFEQQDYDQGFAWFPPSVTFFPLGESGTFWVEILLSDVYKIEDPVDYAVIIPFVVSVEDAIQVGADDRNEIRIVRGISKGFYKLVYQERYLTQSEIDNISVDLPGAEPESEPGLSLGPKLCKLTFIPTSTKCNAEILKAPSELKIKLPLFLHE